MSMLRSNKRISQHVEFLSLLIAEPVVTVEVLKENGVDTSKEMGSLEKELGRRKERQIINQIKERINGSDHQG